MALASRITAAPVLGNEPRARELLSEIAGVIDRAEARAILAAPAVERLLL